MNRRIAPLLAVFLSACASAPGPRPAPAVPPPVATFSIVARDPATGDLGVAVQSRFLGVGSVVPWARAGAGAVATQAWANTTYGPDGLVLMEKGVPPDVAIDVLTGRDPGREFRQVGMVDAAGRAASFTGRQALAWAGHVVGEGYCCQGNILAGEEVVRAMAESFERSTASFPERLVAALEGGQSKGGDKRGRQSAALLVVRAEGGYSGWNDRMIDLRVEDHEDPIAELGRVLALHRRTFGIAPLPVEREGYSVEPAPPAGDASTPRGAFETWAARLRAKDWEGLYALQTLAFRAENPFPAFRAEMEARVSEITSFLDRVEYAGTRLDGPKAKVALKSAGSPRPVLLDFTKEEGEWRMPD